MKKKVKYLCILCGLILLLSGCGTSQSLPTSKYDTESKFYYNELSDAEKAFYDQMKSVCEELYWENVNPKKTTDQIGQEKYYYGEMELGELDSYKAEWIALVFYCSNPKYFFLSTDAYQLHSLINVDGKYGIVIDNEFSDRKKIDEYRDLLEAKTDEWLESLSVYNDDLEKETAICRMIVDNIEYDYSIDSEESKREYFYASNIIGGLINGKSICSGYAKIAQYICNAAGIESVYVLATADGSHAWNMVKLYDEWYCLDTTWLDDGRPITPANHNFNKSYETFKQVDFGLSYHTVDGSFELYEVPVPKCESDSVKGHELFTGNDGDFRVEGGILTEYSGSDRNIIIPGSVMDLDYYVLNKDVDIESFDVADGNGYFSTIDGLLYTKDKTVLMRGPSLMEGELSVPEGTKRIDYGAFAFTEQLTEIRIPGSVRKIGENAFNGSENLRDIYFEGTKKSCEAIDTENVVIPSECEIHFQ